MGVASPCMGVASSQSDAARTVFGLDGHRVQSAFETDAYAKLASAMTGTSRKVNP